MASSTAKTMREEATCPICLELMTEPVMTECGHIYCRSCIMKNLENQQQQSPSQDNFHCPICRAQCQRESIRPSKQLESIIETIKRMAQENLCEEHGERLCLFCEDDGQLICWCCERSPQHKWHTTAFVADVHQKYKNIFQENLTDLRKLKDQNKKRQQNVREQITKLQSEILHKKKNSQNDFKEILQILHMEENTYIWKLENEEKKVLKTLQDSEAQLEEQSQELKHNILELERKCQGSAEEILQNVTDTLNRMSAMKLNTPEDVSWYIPNLPGLDNILHVLLQAVGIYYVTITPDQDTAHNALVVNDHENSVTGGSPQMKHDTPARFKDLPCVLGYEHFNSRKHCFKVCNIRGSEWDVGVCLESVPRDNDKRRDPESGFWAIRRCKQRDYVALTSPLTQLHLEEEIRCLRVFLDYKDGLVSFYNEDTSSHIFTFPKASFSKRLRPYFRIGEGSYLHFGENRYW